MMERKDDDLLLVTLVVALLRDGLEGDPYLDELLYRTIRNMRRSRQDFDPELEHLLERALHHPRRPRRLEEMREVAGAALDGFRKSFQERVEYQIGELSSRVDALAEAQKETSATLEASQQDHLTAKDTIHSFLWLLESGADVRTAQIMRYVPVRIFLGDPVPNENVREALVSHVEALVKPFDLERDYELPEESGSWWKRFVLRTTGFFTHEEVQKRLQKAERALEVKCLDKPQAEANHLQAQAAAGLIGALGTTPNACIQVGTLLVVKATDCDGKAAVVARTLTDQELKMLEENQSALRKPETVLEFLQSPRGRLTSR